MYIIYSYLQKFINQEIVKNLNANLQYVTHACVLYECLYNINNSVSADFFIFIYPFMNASSKCLVKLVFTEKQIFLYYFISHIE